MISQVTFFHMKILHLKMDQVSNYTVGSKEIWMKMDWSLGNISRFHPFSKCLYGSSFHRVSPEKMGKFSRENSFHLKDGALETIHFFSRFRPGKKFGGGPRIVTNHHFHLKYAFLIIQTIFTRHTHFHLNSAIVKEQNCRKSRITWRCTIWVNWQLR